MSSILKRAVSGVMRSFSMSGVGTDVDPFRPIHDVNLQDQTTPMIILPLAQQLGLNTLVVDGVQEEYSVTVTDDVGMAAGHHFRIINIAADRYYFGTILDVTDDVVTLDTPLDFAYGAGSEVTYSNINMAVKGDVTPVHFHLRTGTPSIPSSVDITKMIIVAQCATAVDLNKFGDLSALTRGLLFRISNGHLHNIWNVKSNADLVNISFDFTPFVASNPFHAVDGFVWMLKFGGQGNIGVVHRVLQDGQLGIIVQDDLTSLTSLTCFLEGHVVDP